MQLLIQSKKNESGGITSVFVLLSTTTKEPDWHFVTHRLDIEGLILDRNILHFSHTGETPLASNEVIDMLGFGGWKEI